MPEYSLTQPQAIGLNRNLITPADTYRGLDFTSVLVVSGGLSGAAGISGTYTAAIMQSVSGPEILRLHNIDFHSRDGAGWMLVEIRDGAIATGRRIAGPWYVQQNAERQIGPAALAGRYAQSSITVVVLSGANANPLSNGLSVTASWFRDPLDLPGERQT